jgi:predicted secreted hydrolase
MRFPTALLSIVAAVLVITPAAHGSTVDGDVLLDGYPCHAATRVTIDENLAWSKWCNDSGYYGRFTFVLPGAHSLKFTHPGFCPTTRSIQVPLVGNLHVPDVTLQNCALCNPSTWQHYPYTIPGTAISFPTDDGKHMPFSEFPIEWWYGNYHLTSTSTGKQYAVWVAFFKFPQMVLMSVTDLQTGVTYSADRYPLTFSANENQLGLEASLPPFTDRWYNEVCGGGLHPFDYWMDVSFLTDGVVDGWLHMRSLKKPLAVGGDGHIEVGGGFTNYYSQTRMDVWGVLHLPGGPLLGEEMHGVGWMDHQWGSFPTKRVSWEWLSIQLNDNREIMVADVWEGGVESGSFTEGLNYVGANCTPEVWSNYDMTPLEFWTDPQSGREFAVKWHVTLNEPSRQIDLVVNRRFDECVMRLGLFDLLPLCFWEGPCTVSGTINGQPVSGTAFAEVTHPQACSVGTCCISGEEGCVQMTQAECTGQGGVWGGLCSLCSRSDPCSPQSGACCAPAGTCTVTTEAACTTPNAWQGAGTSCTPNLCPITGIDDPVVKETRIIGASPNPFSGNTSIRYQLVAESDVRLEIYSATGQLVRRLVGRTEVSGEHAVQWDGRDESEKPVSMGVYYARLSVGSWTGSSTLTLRK